MKEIKKTEKRFLSDTPYEYGSVCYTVGLNKDSLEAELRLADCNKVIVLDFSAYGKDCVDIRIEKVDAMIDILEMFKADLLDAMYHREDNQKLLEKEPKKQSTTTKLLKELQRYNDGQEQSDEQASRSEDS